MQPIHLAIGLVEGIVTAGVLYYVYNARPEILDSSYNRTKMGSVSTKKVLTVLIVATLIVGGGLSIFASSYPDGLEWSMEGVAGTTELEAEGSVYDTASSVQETTAFMPDYGFTSSGEEGSAAGTSVAGIVGGALTFALAGVTGLVISVTKKKHKIEAEA